MKPSRIGKVSLDSAEHYTWGGACDGWHLVNSPGLSVIQERMPPGAAEVRHVHDRTRQFFYVLAGKAVIDVDGVSQELRQNEGLEIPPRIPHQVFNRSDEPVDFLVISQPHSHGDRTLT